MLYEIYPENVHKFCNEHTYVLVLKKTYILTSRPRIA